LSLVGSHIALAKSCHENIYAIKHNSVRDIDRDSLICAKPGHIAGYRHQRGDSSERTAENPQEMMKQMMEMSKLNENHKLLSSLDGNWNYTIKFWMNPDPNAPPQESKGTATRKSVMGGRYVMMDVTGKMQMPGEDGKMKDVQFKGMGLEGYDNVKKKFVGSWIDNMGTGIELAEGTYDPATKSFTFTSEMELMPGMKTPVREVLKVPDNNHMMLEWYENRGGQEKKTMEINYTRAGQK
jgi:hypothetical protein